MHVLAGIIVAVLSAVVKADNPAPAQFVGLWTGVQTQAFAYSGKLNTQRWDTACAVLLCVRGVLHGTNVFRFLRRCYHVYRDHISYLCFAVMTAFLQQLSYPAL
jgi:hypothetical protein